MWADRKGDRYTAEGTVNHPERFLVVKTPEIELKSPFSGSPVGNARRLSEFATRDEDSASVGDSTTGRHGSSYGQLALAFVHSRAQAGRSSVSGNLHRLSVDGSYPGSRAGGAVLERENSQDLSGTSSATRTPHMDQSDFTPPSRESGTGTPYAPNNQDPGIPNIELEDDPHAARYQSGMTVSSARRAEKRGMETPPDWSSPAAHQQRDLARLLGQSSARLLEPSGGRRDGEEEEESAQMREEGEKPTPRPGSERTGSLDSPEEQSIPRQGGEGTNPSSSVPEEQPASKPSPAERPENSQTPHTSLSYRETNPSTYNPSLPRLTEDANESAHSIFTNTQPFHSKTTEPSTARPRTTFAAREGPIQRVTGGSVSSVRGGTGTGTDGGGGRERHGSETSDELQRYDVSARAREEAARMRRVWEAKGHLTAPKGSPHEVRRRVKAM